MRLEDLIFTPLVLLLGLGIHQVVLRQHAARFEHRLLNRSFALHMAAGLGLIVVYEIVYGGGADMEMYWVVGVPISDALHYDFAGVFPEVMSLLFHGEFKLPFEGISSGSTGTMQAVAVLLLAVLGNSRVAAAVVISIGSYLAKVFVYRALRTEFPASQHERVLFASTLSPTGIVWTCALLKEPVLMCFFGPAFLGLRLLLEGRRLPLAVAMLIVGATGIVLIKPYVLLALALAGAAWIAWARTLKSGGNFLAKPAYLGVAVAVMMLGFTVVSTIVPSMSPDRVSESIQAQRRASAQETGGSNFYLEGRDAPREEVSPSLLSQVGIMPLALITALFRPFIFESFSPLQFLNAIEMTWLTWMFVQVLRRNGWRRVVTRIMANPGLMFCTIFVLVLALGTGLSTANLGTLSRYRAPMMPFFLLLLVILREPEVQPATAASSALKTSPA